MTPDLSTDAPTDLPASWSAVIVNWNGAADLPACVAALLAQDWPATEIVIVDNASTDASATVIQSLARSPVRALVNQSNLGFAGGANAGIAATSGDLVAILNPDVAIDPNWASALRQVFMTARIGAAGGKLLFSSNGAIQHAGGAIDRGSFVAVNIGRHEPDRGQYDEARDVDFLTGASLMLRRAAVDQIGGFDAGFMPAYYEDVDLCERLRLSGWRVHYTPVATGHHQESASVSAAGTAYFAMIHAGRLRFAAKHLSLADLIGRFLPAEAARLAEALTHAGDDLALEQSGRTVFPTGVLGAGVRSTAPATPDDRGRVPAALKGEAALIQRLTELSHRWRVREQPFASSVPWLGPVIARGRAIINNLAPRWHVLAILSQQVAFNAAAFRAAQATAAEALQARLLGDASARLLAERLDDLIAEQAHLAERLAALEQRLGKLTPPE